MVSLSLHIHLFVLKWTFERHAPQLSSVPLIAALIGSCCVVFIKLNAVLVCSVSFLLFRIGDFCRVWKPDHITVGGKGTRSSGTCFPAWTWRRLIVCCCLYNLISLAVVLVWLFFIFYLFFLVLFIIRLSLIFEVVSIVLIYYYHLTASFPGQPGWAGTRKVKPIWILLEQETVSGSGISWAICKSAPRSRQITTPVPHHSVFYRPDALPAAQPTASKHWRHNQLWYFYVLVILVYVRYHMFIICSLQTTEFIQPERKFAFWCNN